MVAGPGAPLGSVARWKNVIAQPHRRSPVPTSPLVCVAEIGAPHGVRGDVRVRCFTEEPEAIADYGPLYDEAGRQRFALKVVRSHKVGVIARIEGVHSRDDAERLRGTRLYIARDALPELDEETFYHADLIGLRADGVDGEELGTVTAVHDFGAGDILEITPNDGGKSILVPFSKESVPEIDITGGRVVVKPLEGL